MKGSGIPGAEGPAGPNPRARLEAFASVVVELAPVPLVRRLVARLEELRHAAEAEAADRSSTEDRRDGARLRATGYARAASALERAAAGR